MIDITFSMSTIGSFYPLWSSPPKININLLYLLKKRARQTKHTHWVSRDRLCYSFQNDFLTSRWKRLRFPSSDFLPNLSLIGTRTLPFVSAHQGRQAQIVLMTRHQFHIKNRLDYVFSSWRNVTTKSNCRLLKLSHML